MLERIHRGAARMTDVHTYFVHVCTVYVLWLAAITSEHAGPGLSSCMCAQFGKGRKETSRPSSDDSAHTSLLFGPQLRLVFIAAPLSAL